MGSDNNAAEPGSAREFLMTAAQTKLESAFEGQVCASGSFGLQSLITDKCVHCNAFAERALCDCRDVSYCIRCMSNSLLDGCVSFVTYCMETSE